MASIIQRGDRWRALVRRAGITRCETFPSRKLAKAWADRMEAEAMQLRSTGLLPTSGISLGDLITRYSDEVYRIKPWGRSKTAILKRLAADVGTWPAGRITSHMIVEYLSKRRRGGAGAVTLAGIESTLYGVIKTARGLWHLDVPIEAAKGAREAVTQERLIGKSSRRDRRVTDPELRQLVAHFTDKPTSLPMGDVLQFCIASGMRISEVTRLRWADLNETDRTIIVRDRKHPSDKIGNDQTVPLLDATGFDAFAIVKRQPRIGPRIFPYNARTISAYTTRAAAVLGIEDFHLHDLRHEAITRLFAKGYRIEQVALVSGHRDWQMLRRYTHVQARDLHREPKPTP